MAGTPAERLAALSQHEIHYDDLSFDSEIDVGGFGDVWKGVYKVTHQSVAIKTMWGGCSDDAFCMEIETLVEARSRFVVEFVGFTKDPRCIVTKFMANGSLFSALDSDPKGLNLTATDLNTIAYVLAEGVAFLHAKGLIHMDLKLHNILLDENKLPVICDFGSSRRLDTKLATYEGATAQYMAPEIILENHPPTNKVDVYSYAIILWEMLTKDSPYPLLSSAQVACQVIMGRRPIVPEQTPEPLAKLIQQCWSDDPDERPPFQQIVEMFRNGDVIWPGCSAEEFQKRVMARKRGATALPRFRSKPKSARLVRTADSFRKGSVQLPKGIPLGNMDVLLHAHVRALREMDPVRGSSAIVFLTAHVDEPALLETQFWPLVLRVLKFGSKEFSEKMIPLSVLLAQSTQRLCQIRSVPDLHSYVCPASLDVFLYIVSFEPIAVTVEVVDAIANLVDDESVRMKAIVLLCKIESRTEDNIILQKILTKFQSCVNKISEDSCGVLVLRLLLNHGILSDDTIALYLASKITDNVVAGYQALFIREETASISPNLNKVDSLLLHIQTDNHQLRTVALEFVRRYALRVDGTVLSNIIDALLTVVLRYSSENAVLLLCKFASDQQRARSLLSPGSTSIWLFASPAKAVRMMRVFCVLFKQPSFRKELILIPEVPAFLASVLSGSEVEPFLAVCWVIRMADSERDFMLRLDENYVTDGLSGWLLKTTDTRPIQGTTSAMRSIAQYTCSQAFETAIPRLLRLISDENDAIMHCLMLLAKLSEFPDVMDTFFEVLLIC